MPEGDSTTLKRRANALLYFGFAIVLAGVFSYLPIFIHFTLTREFPWANLLMFVVGDAMIAFGLTRAFRRPELYRGKIAGAILAVVSVAILGLSIQGFFFYARQLPASSGAPRVGQKAPEFTLLDKDGGTATLASLLASPGYIGGTAKPNAVVLIFFRGFW